MSDSQKLPTLNWKQVISTQVHAKTVYADTLLIIRRFSYSQEYIVSKATVVNITQQAIHKTTDLKLHTYSLLSQEHTNRPFTVYILLLNLTPKPNHHIIMT